MVITLVFGDRLRCTLACEIPDKNVRELVALVFRLAGLPVASSIGYILTNEPSAYALFANCYSDVFDAVH